MEHIRMKLTVIIQTIPTPLRILYTQTQVKLTILQRLRSAHSTAMYLQDQNQKKRVMLLPVVVSQLLC